MRRKEGKEKRKSIIPSKEPLCRDNCAFPCMISLDRWLSHMRIPCLLGFGGIYTIALIFTRIHRGITRTSAKSLTSQSMDFWITSIQGGPLTQRDKIPPPKARMETPLFERGLLRAFGGNGPAGNSGGGLWPTEPTRGKKKTGN